MAAPAWMAPLQALVDNPLPVTVRGGFVGLIGDHPSTYARSPKIWEPALAVLEMDATYLPLDVPADRLSQVVGLLRRSDACLGANVTVPYKETVTPLLDEVDASAAAIGAINTIVRPVGGRLIGANTDGIGLLSALRVDEAGPLIGRLEGATVLLIGGGGAARAAVVALAPLLGSGELLVTNRSEDRARAVAALAGGHGARARAVPDGELEACLPAVALVINASLRGQAGIYRRPEGWAALQPYSALAPAHPAVLPPMPEGDFLAAWSARSADDVEANHAISRARVRRLPPHAVVYDMIYAPAETTTLRHAREAGLRAANGRGMNIAQAVASCVDHICRRSLDARGVDPEAARALVRRVMAGAWDG